MATDDAESYDAKGKGGRPKEYPKALKVPMTVRQRERVGEMAEAIGKPAAQVVRMLIDGAKVAEKTPPAPSPEIDETLLREWIEVLTEVKQALHETRNETNWAGGNIYRAIRDLYEGRGIATPEDLLAMQLEHQSSLRRLEAIETSVRALEKRMP